jgi:hypothetical protein
MKGNTRLPFLAAVDRYRRAKLKLGRQTKERSFDRALGYVDRALDNLMDVPSPSLGAFGEKVRILEVEYGLQAQPRHIGALYADVAVLAAIYAGTIFQVWPTG